MYKLTGKDKNGNIKVLDSEIPDEFAAQHDANYCGQYYPGYTDFELSPIEEVLTTETKTDTI